MTFPKARNVLFSLLNSNHFWCQNALKLQVAVFINVAELKTVVAETSGFQVRTSAGSGQGNVSLEVIWTGQWTFLKILYHSLFLFAVDRWKTVN